MVLHLLACNLTRRHEHPRHSTAHGGDEGIVTADTPFVLAEDHPTPELASPANRQCSLRRFSHNQDPEPTWACGNLAIMLREYLRKMESNDGWLSGDDADGRTPACPVGRGAGDAQGRCPGRREARKSIDDLVERGRRRMRTGARIAFLPLPLALAMTPGW
jgi:hypothetical protein